VKRNRRWVRGVRIAEAAQYSMAGSSDRAGGFESTRHVILVSGPRPRLVRHGSGSVGNESASSRPWLRYVIHSHTMC
jgi:hypothetical protein